MKLIIKTILAAVLAGGALPAAGSASSSGYGALAGRLAAAASANGIKRLAVVPFSAADGAGQEANFAREKTAAGLSAVKGLVVLDQDGYAAYKTPASWEKLPRDLRPQALVQGSVFRSGEDVTLLAKLVDPRSGRIYGTAEVRSFARFGSALPPLPDMDWGEPPSSAKLAGLPLLPGAKWDKASSFGSAGDFRDAPADDAFDCAAAFRQMNKINAAAVDLKARYWAAKLKDPSFVIGSLTRNPGSEIRDPSVRGKFYKLLSSYYDRAGIPVLSGTQKARLEEFMKREDEAIDRCGAR